MANVVPAFTQGQALRPYDSSAAALAGHTDLGIAALAAARLSAVEALITTTTASLQAAAAQLMREEVYVGTGAGQATQVRQLAEELTALEGKKAFYEAAIAVLNP